MSDLPYARHFSELIVWQHARRLARDVFEVSREFPKEEMYSLTDQVRRSSRSVGAQLAEAWGKRKYIKHFRSKLTDADGEQYETQNWLIVAYDCGYLDRDTVKNLGSQCKEIGAMIGKMDSKADEFCGDFGSSAILRESIIETDYFNTEYNLYKNED